MAPKRRRKKASTLSRLCGCFRSTPHPPPVIPSRDPEFLFWYPEGMDDMAEEHLERWRAQRSLEDAALSLAPPVGYSPYDTGFDVGDGPFDDVGGLPPAFHGAGHGHSNIFGGAGGGVAAHTHGLGGHHVGHTPFAFAPVVGAHGASSVRGDPLSENARLWGDSPVHRAAASNRSVRGNPLSGHANLWGEPPAHVGAASSRRRQGTAAVSDHRRQSIVPPAASPGVAHAASSRHSRPGGHTLHGNRIRGEDGPTIYASSTAASHASSQPIQQRVSRVSSHGQRS